MIAVAKKRQEKRRKAPRTDFLRPLRVGGRCCMRRGGEEGKFHGA